ncbi:MAG: DUF4962 domain-containing protein, partial [Planctomycetota bacterium]
MRALIALTALLLLVAPAQDRPELRDDPARPGEWGYHPREGAELTVTPPGFTWRWQKKAVTYDLEMTGEGGARKFEGIKYCVFCPDKPIAPGRYAWRFRFVDGKGRASDWSRKRSFTIREGATEFPLPGREDVLAKIPKKHPRLFVRPEDIPELKKLAETDRQRELKMLLRKCKGLAKNPPPTEEPPKYPKDVARKSEEWRKIWWGNRTYTRKVLESAALLGFTGLIAEKPEYRGLAKRLLMDAAKWDPHGATGYIYNDEAGMPYAYHFSRTYTFVHDILSEEERELCRRVMRARGKEMYAHLHPRHLWRPYSSHSNRAWHFLGEVGIAFLDEIPEAADWVWFAMNVFRCVYPVWCDDDGGWHEGISYWSSYIGRFAWWAGIMKVATGVDAYKKPYFSKVGYYPIYMMP